VGLCDVGKLLPLCDEFALVPRFQRRVGGGAAQPVADRVGYRILGCIAARLAAAGHDVEGTGCVSNSW